MDPRDFGTFNLSDILMNAERIKSARAQRQQYEQQVNDRRRLGELLPGAMHGDQSAMDELAGLNPELFMRLDDRQKEQAKAEIADLTQAVRWADTPEKWAQVQQHFGQKGIDLSGYTVADRERGMLALGKLGEYLESAPKMDIRATEPGGGLYGVDPRSGQVNVLVQPNDGSGQMGAVPPPPPGFVIEGGPTGAPSGGFPR